MRVLLLAEDPDRAAEIAGALRGQGVSSVAHVRHGADLLAEIRRTRPDVVLVHADALEQDTLRQIGRVSSDDPRPIALFTQEDDPLVIRSAVRSGVNAYVARCLDTGRLKTVIEVAMARFEEEQELKKALEDSRLQLAQRKVIERAKGVVMKQRGMDEEQAYRLLRRLAMDRGKSLHEVAETIVAADELLADERHAHPKSASRD